jgi:hypothetical protein
MFIEMELLAREQHERRLREAEEFRLHRTFRRPQPATARGGRRITLPRLRER